MKPGDPHGAPIAQAVHELHQPLAKGLLAHEGRPAVVAERGGHDFGDGDFEGGHDHDEMGGDEFGGGGFDGGDDGGDDDF